MSKINTVLPLHEGCYHGGASFTMIGEEFSHLEAGKKVIRADVTDAWYDPPPSVIEKVHEYLPWLMKNSPPTYSEGLIKTISEVRGIPRNNLIAGGGSSMLMFIFFQNYSCESVATLDPTYAEYGYIFKNVLGKKPLRVVQTPADNFKISIGDLVAQAPHSDILVLVNPNSPTGQHLSKKEMQELLGKLPQKTLLFVDETYVDFLGKGESVETLVPAHKNLVVLKSMSKVYALSGTRVAYLVAPGEIIRKIKRYLPPWSVGLIGQVAGVEALKNWDYYEKMISKTHVLREDLATGLRAIPKLQVYPSAANFLLMGLEKTGKSAHDVDQALSKHGVWLRKFSGNLIRTAVKDGPSNAKISGALKIALK